MFSRYCKTRVTIFLLVFTMVPWHLFGQDVPQIVDLTKISTVGAIEFDPSAGGSYRLKPEGSDGAILIDDPEILKAIPSSRYLVLKVSHPGSYSGILYIEFFGGGKNPRLTARIGILPGLMTRVVFPFDYLDGQEIFLSRMPPQLKGVVFGSRIDPRDLTAIRIFPRPYRSPDFEPVFLIDSIFLSNKILPYEGPSPEPLVDRYGQWSKKNWKGKITSDKEFDRLTDELDDQWANGSEFTGDFSRYGGWKALRFDSTGYFHTHFDGSRWWFADPEGYAFLSSGMDCVVPGVYGTLQGDEDLYEWLPAADSGYQDAYGNIRELRMVDFFQINMIRRYGKDWRTRWEKITREKLISSGFNTVGNWSDQHFILNSRMPWVLPLSNYPTTEVKLFRDFPDVYSPQYKVDAGTFARQLEKYKDDPFLIGYFLRNEPKWAFGAHDIAFEMFATSSPSFSKLAFVQWLDDTYHGDVEELNRTWGLDLNTFADLNLMTFNDYPSERSKQDFADFSGQLVEKYIKTVCDEVKKIDRNHLNLGMRYGGISSDLLYRAGEYFDVFSINGYHAPGPPATSEIFEKTGKPVMIGEFHFGAIDRGLPSTGLRGVASTRDRGKAYRYYLEQGFARPELIGIHYFQWMDQAFTGRFDGENYNIGFNDILYRSYPELMRAASKTHKRVYEVAEGKKKPFSRQAKSMQSIAF